MLAVVLLACTPDDAGTDRGTPPTDPPTTGSTGDTGRTGTTGSTGATADTGAEDCAVRCDDGLDCSLDTCDALGRCIAVPLSTCAWPASVPPGVLGLGFADVGLQTALSGAAWDPVTRALWVVRGSGGTAWRFLEDGAGSYAIDGRWSLGDLDAESVTVVDPIGAPDLIHVMDEADEVIVAVDISGDPAVAVRTWDTSSWLPQSGLLGAEGLAFVPDDALSAWGFVDEVGVPRTSALGMGGLFFVGHQNGGLVHVFDLSATTTDVEHVGTYETARGETAALEFDAGTGRLYIWHGDSNDLEVVRLSSTDTGGARRVLDTEYVFDHPGLGNLEGFALAGLEDCGPDGRPFTFTTDDGAERSLDVGFDWPLCRP